MKKNNSRTIKSIVWFLSSFAYLLLAYAGYKGQHIDLNRINKLEGVIADKGVVSTKGNYGIKSPSFFIQLTSSNKKFALYRTTGNYKDLLDKCNAGEWVTVYYRAGASTEAMDNDLVQIEKGTTIVLDKKENENKSKFLIYLGIFAAALNIYLSYLYYRGKIYPDKLRHSQV